jgi:hypothetical protein
METEECTVLGVVNRHGCEHGNCGMYSVGSS